jgi:glyoxylase-like metal-dependent hydrolase (beta-lactamase superfamily II)
MTVWNVGKAKITAIVEQPLNDLNGLIQNASQESLADIPWLRPHFVDADGTLLGVVQTFVIEVGDALIVVDTCVGDNKDLPSSHEWDKRVFGLYEKFKAAGFDPDRVDFVLCTHLHLDHVGMNTLLIDGAFVPTFPAAQYLFARTEFEFWASEYEQPEQDLEKLERPFERMRATFHKTQKNVHDQSVQPIVDAGLVVLVDPPREIVPGVTLIPTPGHTPGHVSVQIISEGDKAIITGDSFHHPCQIARMDWGTFADIDRDTAKATRQAMLEEMSGTDALMIGSHFSWPTAGRIVPDGTSYRFELED